MERVRWLIDGLNVVGARPDGWWRDRPAAIRRLVSKLDSFQASRGGRMTVVFDGARVELPESRVDVVFAGGGPQAADREIARRVTTDPDPSTLMVVTSDVALGEKVEAAGARLTAARSFRERVESISASARDQESDEPPSDMGRAGE